jgi:hypothetical protein
MSRDDWYAVLESTPLTDNQRGAIMGHFERLWLHPRYDRAERLRICAALLGLDQLDSVKSLTMGEAGRLLQILRGIRNRVELRVAGQAGELAAANAAGNLEDEPVAQDEDGPGNAVSTEFNTWPQVISRIIDLALLAFGVRPSIDDGLFGHGGCCSYSRSSGCGRGSCPCRQEGEESN